MSLFKKWWNERKIKNLIKGCDSIAIRVICTYLKGWPFKNKSIKSKMANQPKDNKWKNLLKNI